MTDEPDAIATTVAASGPDARAPASVVDYVSIQRLVHRYADAVVHRDASRWESCWADDAVWDLGGGRPVEGRRAIVQLWQGAMDAMQTVVQIVHNGEVFGGGVDDTATGRWYVSERYRTTDGTEGVLIAHYDDTYVREGGRWLFSGRRLVPHHHGAPAGE